MCFCCKGGRAPVAPNQALELAMLTGYMVAYATSQRYFPGRPSPAVWRYSRFSREQSNCPGNYSAPGLLLFGEERRDQPARGSRPGWDVVVLYKTHFPCHRAAHHRRLSLMEPGAAGRSGTGHRGRRLQCRPDERTILFSREISLDGQYGALVDAWTIACIGRRKLSRSTAPERRIDYVFYQAEPSVIVQETKVLGRHPMPLSEHAAVVATSPSPPPATSAAIRRRTCRSLEPTGGGKFAGY